MFSSILSIIALAATIFPVTALPATPSPYFPRDRSFLQKRGLPESNFVNAVVHAVKESHSGKSVTAIEYQKCDSVGDVTNITISPCEGGDGSVDSPCQFHYGSNYTIVLTYTSTISSSAPRANLIARDRSGYFGPGDKTYPYSGQSFGACSYTSCPIPVSTPSTYTYEFKTLKSPFDRLTFNATDGLTGPSFLCAGFDIDFIP